MFRHVLRTLSGGVAVLAGAAILSFTLVPGARAVESLKITAPAKPGGGWDSTARSMQHALQSAGIVKNVQVNNVPGAGGTVGLAALVNSQKGDGNQLMVNGLVMVGAILTNKSPVTLAQATPIARLTGEYEVIVVPAASSIKSMTGLVDALKKDPGAVSWAGGSAGGTDHILAGLVAQAAGVDPTRINYIPFSGGGEALAALLGNHVTAGISGWGEFADQIRAGKLRALALSSDKRLAGVDVPTLKEQGIDVEFANWRSVMAPPGLSAAQRTELIGIVDKMVKSREWREILAKQDWTDLYLPGDEFGRYLAAEQTRVEKILRTVGLVK